MAKPEVSTDQDSEPDLLEEIQNRYEAAKTHAKAWRTEAREAFDIYAGKQWSDKDIEILNEQMRPPVTFNRVAILIDAVIGYEVNNRQETRYIPRTPGDAKVNEYLTEAARYFRDNCDAEFEESDAFRDMCISGMGWTNDRLSDERNPEFDLVRDRVDPLRMLWDPSSRKPNLEDARYVFYEGNYSKDEAKALVPEWDGEYHAADWLTDDNDVTGTENPRDGYKADQGNDKGTYRHVKVLEYQFCEDIVEHHITRPASMDEMGQPVEAQTAVLSEDDWENTPEDARKMFQPFHTTKRKRVWKRVFMIGTQTFDKEHPYPKGPTYHCVTGKRDRNTGHWFGLIRSLKDPQMWSNKFLSQIMHLLNTSAKSGYDVEQGAIKSPSDFEAKAARPGAINVFTDGALRDGRVQRREASGLPPDLPNLLQYSNESMSDVSGVNQELLGMADRDQPGVLEYQRKQSAVTLLAPLFDSFRRYRKISGRCWLHFMQNYLTDGRLIRITKDDGDQVNMPFTQEPQPNPAAGQPADNGEGMEPAYIQFFDPSTSEYDVIVDQSATSPNLKEATWAAIQPMIPTFMESGPEMVSLVLEYSPLPESFLEKFNAIVEQKAKEGPPPDPEMMKVQAQMQAKQAELQMKAQDDERRAQMEIQKAQAQLQLEREKAMLQMQIQREQAQQEMQIAEMKAQHDLRLKSMQANVQAAVAMEQAKADNSRADFKTASDAKRMDQMAKAKAKAASKTKPKVNA